MDSNRPAWDDRHHLAAPKARELPKRPKFRTMNGAPVRPVLQFDKPGRHVVQRTNDSGQNSARLNSAERSAGAHRPQPPRQRPASDTKPRKISAGKQRQQQELTPMWCPAPPPSHAAKPVLTIDHVEDCAELAPQLPFDLGEQCTCVQELARLGPVGRGSTAQVYKALHIPSLKIVAEKALPATGAKQCMAIAKELLVTSQLLQASADGTEGKCPYLVDIVKVKPDHQRGIVCICMEYMDGGSLQDIVASGGCQNEHVLAGVAKQVLLGLEYMHRRHVIHRDIKPGNLLINRWGVVKISDFGIARHLETQIEAETFVGTYSYMSPERIIAEPYSYASDIWSFGLSMLALFLGRHPCEGANGGGYWGVVQAIRGREFEIPPECSREFKEFISLCLQQEAASRPSAAALLGHAFLTKYDLHVNDEQLALKLSIGRCASRPNADQVDDSVRWFADRQQRQQLLPAPVELSQLHQSNQEALETELETSTILETIKAYYIAAWKAPKCACPGHVQELIPRWTKASIHELARQLDSSGDQLQALFRPLVEELKQAANAVALEQHLQPAVQHQHQVEKEQLQAAQPPPPAHQPHDTEELEAAAVNGNSQEPAQAADVGDDVADEEQDANTAEDYESDFDEDDTDND